MSISTTPVHLRKLLANYLRPWRARVVVLTVCLLASIGAQLVNPQMLRFFIDAAQRGDPARRLLQAAVIFLLIALVDQALSVVVTYLGQDVGWRATNRLRADLAAHCLRLDMPFHNTITPGELIERIDGDVTLLSNLFSTLVIRIFSGVLLVMGIILLLVREEPLAGLLFTGWVAVTFLWLYYTRRLAIPHVGAERQASAQLFGFIEERLGGLPDIKANGGVAYTLRRLRAVNDYLLQKGRQSWVMNSIGWSAASVALALGNALALGMGACFYQQGHITLGTVYLFFHYSMLLFRPVEMLTRQLQDLQRAGAGLDKPGHRNRAAHGRNSQAHGAAHGFTRRGRNIELPGLNDRRADQRFPDDLGLQRRRGRVRQDDHARQRRGGRAGADVPVGLGKLDPRRGRRIQRRRHSDNREYPSACKHGAFLYCRTRRRLSQPNRAFNVFSYYSNSTQESICVFCVRVSYFFRSEQISAGVDPCTVD